MLFRPIGWNLGDNGSLFDEFLGDMLSHRIFFTSLTTQECERLFEALAAEKNCNGELLRQFLSHSPVELRFEKYVAVFLRDLCLMCSPAMGFTGACLLFSEEQLRDAYARAAARGHVHAVHAVA